jgi:hypothetical protein
VCRRGSRLVGRWPRGQAAHTVRMAKRDEFSPAVIFKIKISFLFLLVFIHILNFEISYLNVQSSKNYETSSIGLIIL